MHRYKILLSYYNAWYATNLYTCGMEVQVLKAHSLWELIRLAEVANRTNTNALIDKQFASQSFWRQHRTPTSTFGTRRTNGTVPRQRHTSAKRRQDSNTPQPTSSEHIFTQPQHPTPSAREASRTITPSKYLKMAAEFPVCGVLLISFSHKKTQL